MYPESNSHSSAAGAYGATASTSDPRMLEGQILLKAALKLENLAIRLKAGEKVDFREVGEILDYNQKLWIIFVSDAADPAHPMPQEIKNNIASLGVFIFQRTLEVRADPVGEKLQILININRNIAAGLMKQPPGMGRSIPPASPSSGTTEDGKTDSII